MSVSTFSTRKQKPTKQNQKIHSNNPFKNLAKNIKKHITNRTQKYKARFFVPKNANINQHFYNDFFAIFAYALPILLCFFILDFAKCASFIALGERAKYQNLAHFDYVNPNAPKGGTLKSYSLGSFSSLNPFSMEGVWMSLMRNTRLWLAI